MKRVSNSELRTFKRCRRKWWLTFHRKLRLRRPPVTGPAQLGHRVHEALRAYYSLEGEHGRDAAVARLDHLRDEELEGQPEQREEILKEDEFARLMVVGYCDWLEETGSDLDLEVIGNEQAFEASSPVPGVNLVGRVDLRVRKRSTGDVGFVDHKTVGDLRSPLAGLSLDEQFRMYALMWKLLEGEEPQLVRFQVYNMLRKVKRTVRAKPPFYDRYEVYINDHELRAFWQRLWGEVHDLLAVELKLLEGQNHRTVAYPNPTRDCSWDCDFFQVCPMFDDDAADVEHVVTQLYEQHDPLRRYDDLLDAETSA